MSRRFTVTLAAAFALLAVVSCLAYGEEVRAEGERERQESLERYGGEVVGLVVATESLEAGDIVTTSNAEMRDWVSDLVPEGAMTSLDGVVGRRLTEPVAAGAPLCELNFRENESSLDIPSGKVALSIPVSDKLGVTRDVSAGDRLIAYRISDNSVSQ